MSLLDTAVALHHGHRQVGLALGAGGGDGGGGGGRSSQVVGMGEF